ncbi:MAG: bifunctional dihydroorotate dehydrogenase B NAD binding subunit/NADPH-dependent glutamate synthase [Bacteroidales bacterium]|nr:bifunctional dihydroorotate dehydrogenase B NAD binding subunit/NADPH-dependent glutamate synthase [Bacteroidales bacterium]
MFKILEKRQLTENIVLFKVHAPNVALKCQPGQFVIVVDDEKGERLPFTICDFDRKEETITLVIQIVGDGSKKLAQMEAGQYMRDIAGPLGNPSELIEDVENLKDKRIVFIAGGLGTAPVYPQAKWAKQAGVAHDVIIGTKTKSTLIYEEEMKEVADNLYVCTDDGSYGFNGMVTACLEDLVVNKGMHYDIAVAIGPMIMMKFVCLMTKKLGIKTIVSLNSLMVDGTGMCGACRVTVGGEMKFACVDGPEFDGHLVDFDQAMQRQRMFPPHKIAFNTPEHKCNLADKVEASLAEFDKKKRVPVREQDPDVRNKNFEEVCFGYNDSEAKLEASRCLNCKVPMCVKACPVNINIPAFIHEIAEGNNEEAIKIIHQSSSLPAICGRVCPQESQCEGSCIMGKKNDAVAIGKLERYVADWARDNNVHEEINIEKNGNKVAVIGSGPSSLACASDLAKMGYTVTIFEALHRSGGVLSYGIPEFRLPKSKVVEKEIEEVTKLGVEINCDVLVGKSMTVDDLFEQGYKAVYIATGAGTPKFMPIDGINLNGVVSANEFLTRVNLMKAYSNEYETPVFVGKKTVVVGGGNVAMDAARSAKRLGSDVSIVYRRTIEEMPARKEEVHHAKEEGINFKTLNNPVEILADDKGWVRGIRCIEMELGEPDASGRRKPVEKPGSEFDMECDCVIMALGTDANKLITSTTENLDINKRGNIVADDSQATSRPGVFAGGDIVSGAATVILAMGAGRKAAASIDEYIKSL